MTLTGHQEPALDNYCTNRTRPTTQLAKHPPDHRGEEGGHSSGCEGERRGQRRGILAPGQFQVDAQPQSQH